MGITESIESWMEPETQEQYLQPGWNDRLADYDAATCGTNSSSGDMKSQRFLRTYEMSRSRDATYGTLKEPKAHDQVTLGSYHCVGPADTLPELCLRYVVEPHAIRDKNSTLSVDDIDIHDLAFVVVPRTLDAPRLGKEPSKAAQKKSSAEPAWYAAAANDAAVRYCDDWVCVTPQALVVRHLVRSRDGASTGALPLSSIAHLRQLTRSAVTANHVIPWAVTTAESTGYVLGEGSSAHTHTPHTGLS